jgi:hypothetical protein
MQATLDPDHAEKRCGSLCDLLSDDGMSKCKGVFLFDVGEGIGPKQHMQANAHAHNRTLSYS